MLSQEAKAIILQPQLPPCPNSSMSWCLFVPKPNRSPPPCLHNINEHDIQHLIACLYDLHRGSQPDNIDDNNNVDGAISAPEDQPEEQPLLAHLTKRKPLPPGNIKQLLSPAASNKACSYNQANNPGEPNQPHEVNVNGIIYCEVH